MLCINCGYHIADGKKITTDMDAPAKSPAKKPAAKKGKPAEKGFAKGYAVERSTIAEALDARLDEAKPNKFIELWLPLGLIIVGLMVNLVVHLYFSDSPAEGLLKAAIAVSLEVVVRIPLLLLGMLVAVKLLDVTFGPLGKALFKLLAVVLGPSAIGVIILVSLMNMIGYLPAAIIGSLVSLGIYWGLLTWLFALEAMEAFYLIIIIWVINRLAGVLLAFMIL